jgi:hypothetical protein
MEDEGSGLAGLPENRVRRISLVRKDDARGSLLPFDFASLPFLPRRLFVVHDVPPGTVRGGHAHKRARQLLVCLFGRIDVELRDGGRTEMLILDSADSGLLIEAGVWSAQTYVAPGSMLLVLASEPYDAASYLDP